MRSIEQICEQISRLDLAEARQVFECLRRNFGPLISDAGAERVISGIDASPGVCGGEPRIVRTRIPVWVLEQMRRQGLSEGDILKSYPTLRAEDLVNAWNYVDAHRSEIEKQILDHEEA